MKTVLAALLIAAPALAALSLEGTFDRAKDVAFLGYQDEQACKSDDGRWDAKEKICFFEADDTVTVTNSTEGLKVAVMTISTNGRTCHFEGKGTQISEREIVASMDTEEYIAKDGSEDGEYVPAKCQVKVTYTDENTVNVTTLSEKNACAEICSYSASLEINGAVRRQ